MLRKTRGSGREEQTATISVEQAAKILKIGRNQAYEAARNGQIPTLKIGKRLLVLNEPLQRMLAGEGRAPRTTKTA
jgi:excisionase family DNA binding protein